MITDDVELIADPFINWCVTRDDEGHRYWKIIQYGKPPISCYMDQFAFLRKVSCDDWPVCIAFYDTRA